MAISAVSAVKDAARRQRRGLPNRAGEPSTSEISNQEGGGSCIEVKTAAEPQLSVIPHTQIVTDKASGSGSHCSAKFPIKTKRESCQSDNPKRWMIEDRT